MIIQNNNNNNNNDNNNNNNNNDNDDDNDNKQKNYEVKYSFEKYTEVGRCAFTQVLLWMRN